MVFLAGIIFIGPRVSPQLVLFFKELYFGTKSHHNYEYSCLLWVGNSAFFFYFDFNM